MKGRWPITLMCEVLQVSASGYFRWDASRRDTKHAGRRLHSDEALLAHIRAIHEQLRGEYGWPRMHRELLARGLRVGKERVRRLMQRHGIRAKGRRKFVVTTDSAHRLPVAPDLVQRRFTPAAPNVVWSGDITYIATDEGWLYLAAVLDLASRRIVGWSMSETIDATLVCTALKSAWWQRKPSKGVLVHTDRGSQYASGQYRALADELGITMSMSRKANAWDNAPMESFFKTLKVERVHQVRYETRAQARQDIVDWIEGWYNRQRLHSANGFLTPVAWENTRLAA